MFLLSGLWHGAALHFVVWGGVHGALLLLEKALTPCGARNHVGSLRGRGGRHCGSIAHPEMCIRDRSNAEDIDTYADYLQSQLTAPLAGDPHACVMDAGWFYDLFSYTHLDVYKRQELRTGQLQRYGRHGQQHPPCQRAHLV